VVIELVCVLFIVLTEVVELEPAIVIVPGAKYRQATLIERNIVKSV